jgi:pimeloyl-ACP methyl ester carboxylesterase
MPRSRPGGDNVPSSRLGGDNVPSSRAGGDNVPSSRPGGDLRQPPDPSVTRIDGPWRHLEVHANGIRFHVVEANGPDDATVRTGEQPLVILLHGFGSFWWSWRHQLRALTGARVVAVDLRGYGGSDKPPRGYDGWTLAGDTAGLVRALGHKRATLVGHADGGLVCWATSVLHPRAVRAIALVSSPHPVALRASVLTRRDQGLALLPWMLRYQLPWWPEHVLTRNDAQELELLVRSRASAKWLASEDFYETIGHMRRAIQIPSAAHSALEYQRWAVRSQVRGEGRRFMRSMKRPLAVPVLHMRGDADPYVLAEPVDRTQRYAPHGRYVSLAGAGHYGHEEAPDQVNDQLMRFLGQVYVT